MSTIIYHNPRCSKSRQTLELLEKNNVNPEIVRYLETPLSSADLTALLKKLNLTAIDVIRKKEKIISENDIDIDALTEKELIELVAEYPILLERPIVVNGDKAAIGRPPENVLSVL